MKLFNANEVFKCIKEYYKSFIDDDIIEILKNEADIFVWREKKSGIKIAITRENLTEPISILGELQVLMVGKFFQDYDYELDNKKMNFYKGKGFHLNDSAEFLFRYSTLENELPDAEMANFKIDNVEFEIGEPSEMFKVLFHHFSQDVHFKWKNTYTIKLKNINKEILESYLQSAMYVIHKNAPSIFVGDYPHIYKYLYTHEYYYDDDPNDEKEESKIEKCNRICKYPEALAFYNEGKQNKDFLSFYKVLEYFFIINRKDEFEAFITTYSKDNDLDKLLGKFTNIYTNKEGVLLEKFINKIENIGPLLKFAIANELISENADKEEFAKKLYEFRNSRVHGKGDAKFELLVPTILVSDDNNDWEFIIENLAELIIQQFCFSQSE